MIRESTYHLRKTGKTPMLSYERQNQIYSFIRKYQSARVIDLGNQMGISLSTVRRDLKELEERGLVTRVHGGAVLTDSTSEEERPALLRSNVQAEAKQRIGAAAAQLVTDGDTIILTSGSTVDAMLPHITARRDLTVVTNVITIAYKLAAYPHITVVVLGGWLRHSEFSLLGQITQQALQDLHVHKIFHGTYGVGADYGLTGTYVQEVETDRFLINAATELIVLADSSKLSRMGPIRLVPTERINQLITDTHADENEVRQLEACGVRVIRV
jgi:DeoR family transcriptional regulator of aga operon